jgi:hypothetical protein
MTMAVEAAEIAELRWMRAPAGTDFAIIAFGSQGRKRLLTLARRRQNAPEAKKTSS